LLVLIERVCLSNIVHRTFHRFQDIVGELAFSHAPKCPGQTAGHGRMPSVEQSTEDTRQIAQ